MGYSPLLTRGFSSISKGFPRTSHCHLYFPCITFFFSRHHGVKASIFIVYELFHQNVLLDISHTFHTSFTNLTCTYTQLSRFNFFFYSFSFHIFPNKQTIKTLRPLYHELTLFLFLPLILFRLAWSWWSLGLMENLNLEGFLASFGSSLGNGKEWNVFKQGKWMEKKEMKWNGIK